MRAAEERVERAMHEAELAHVTVMQLAQDLEALEVRVSAAIDAVVASQTDVERSAAKAKLQQLQKDKHELEQRLIEAKKDAIESERTKRMQLSPECVTNPQAPGCP